jgi:hypothetical protein
MAAIIGLPGVPALYHCHGATFFDAVPVHPRIVRYLAVSSTLAQRIAVEAGIAEADITVVLNAVDLRRFKQVRDPAAVPARVALFGNQLAFSPLAKTISAAVEHRGLEVDFIGRSFGNEIGDPETVLPHYDLVFASGKSAIDAIACGCAVIIVGLQGCGELVEPENFERLRGVNFTIPVNSSWPEEQTIEAALARYRPDAVRAVTLRLRAEAGLDRLVDTFERQYDEVVLEHRTAIPEEQSERMATATYLRSLASLTRTLGEGSHAGQDLAARALGLLSGCAPPTG